MKFLAYLHRTLGLFFLPIFLLISLTGSLYLSGIKGGSELSEITLPKPKNEAQLAEYIIANLKKNNLPLPNSDEIYTKKGSKKLGHGKVEITIKEKTDSIIVQAENKDWLATLMELHKGDGKWYFKILTYAFVLAVLLIYISAVLTTIKRVPLKQTITTILAGLAITVFFAMISI